MECEQNYEFISNNPAVTCNNGTWTQIPKCQPARYSDLAIYCIKIDTIRYLSLIDVKGFQNHLEMEWLWLQKLNME